MLPINFLFLTVWPVVDMRLRYKTGGKGYPPGVPQETTKVLELDVVSYKRIQAPRIGPCRVHFYIESCEVNQQCSFADKMGTPRA